MIRKVTVGGAVLISVVVLWRVFAPAPAPVNAFPARTTVVCFGDSLTAGTGAPEGKSYPDVLARRLGRAVINAGVPGDTTADALARLERDVLVHDPGVVCLTLGGNDLMRQVPADEAFANLETIVRRLQDAGALVVVGGLDPPMVAGSWDDRYESLCEDLGCLLIPDILAGVWGHSDLMADRIHPNARGYEKVAERFADRLEPWLE
jgi:lysophospholipase L1-like esterase